jgi:hypothetical protein
VCLTVPKAKTTCMRAHRGTQPKKGKKNLDLKFKVFPSSDQKSDDTLRPKHDLCDFEASIRIKSDTIVHF